MKDNRYFSKFLSIPCSVLKTLPWWIYHFSGLRHIWEMATARRPNAPDYEKPPTLLLWIIGLYVALYGIASTRYEAALDRVENRMGAVASQLSTSDDEAFRNLITRIPHIQRMETPLEPDLLWPFRGHFIWICAEADEYLKEYLLPSNRRNEKPPRYFLAQSLVCERRNPEILAWTRKTIETWKGKLGQTEEKKGEEPAWVDLREVNLFGARLKVADCATAPPSTSIWIGPHRPT
uniref:Uncharacterized protein n=1 Tax=Candidatus Kentrum sp. TC TaxID=2126339 RepID=A0A450YBG4_9GAMM|nr:MAG: hypothetical protein BECKTC1821E_GA0114239_10038 [Candidatus Kentron sp. TC]